MNNTLNSPGGAAPRIATLPTRPPVAVTCPHCWAEQRSHRDFCQACGTAFVYLDETTSSLPAPQAMGL